MGHFRNGTPTAGLEIISGTLPLHLEAKQEAMKGFIRHRVRNTEQLDSWDGFVENRVQKGHLYHNKQYLALAGIDYNVNYDNIPRELNWVKNFKVEDNKQGWDVDTGDLQAYTDGSRINDKGGAGVSFVHRFDDPINHSFYLGADATVFQAEIFAIYKAAELALTILNNSPYMNRRLVILSDSQAAIQAVNNKYIKNKTVKNAVNMLNLLGTTTDVTLLWIKAHVGHSGNEMADNLAKEGAGGAGESIILPTANTVTNLKIKDHLIKEWRATWANLDACRQTKIFFNDVNINFSKKLVRLNRKDYSKVVRWVTGFAFLRRHNFITRMSHTPTCRYCDQDDETSSHIITQCPNLIWLRADCFKQYTMHAVNPEWRPFELVRYLRAPPVANLEDPEQVE